MKHDVFISYSSKNIEIADAICSTLENEGIKCWIAPRNIVPGKEWGEEIIEGINNSRMLILVFSSASNESKQVLREIERAVNKSLIIITYRMEDVLPTKSLEYFLYSTHWLDAFDANQEVNMSRLLHNTKKFLAQSEEEAHIAMNQQKKKAGRKKIFTASITICTLIVLTFIALNLNGIRKEMISSKSVSSKQTEAAAGTNQANQAAAVSAGKGENDKAQTALDNGKAQSADGKSKDTVVVLDQKLDKPSAANNNSTDSEVKKGASSKTASAVSGVQFKEGQYVRFGTYNGKPIDWRIIHLDKDGSPLLLSTKIVTLKSFDAAESGKYHEAKDGSKFDVHMAKEEVNKSYSKEQLRQMLGSNNWDDSNIREWLNSEAKSVSYSTMRPSGAAVSGGENDYSKEQGFLYNFSSSQKALIKSVTHKTILAEADKGSKSGGSTLYAFSKTDIKSALSNYNSAYYKNISDKVFLLSVDEVANYLDDKGWDLRAGLTQEAKDRDKSGWYNDLKGQLGDYFMWCLRTPAGSSSSEVCIVNSKGSLVYSDYAAMAGGGIRPALYIQTANPASGNGSEDNPYVFE